MRHATVLVTALALALCGAGPALAVGPAPWRAPVPGAVTRGFEPGAPYAGGHHRGADLAAAPGTVVRAACPGRVVVARRVGSSGRVVTVRCGRWRVSVLPLAALAVREGARVTRGARLGTAASSPEHAGVHLGVRREGRRFGYTDPLRFLAVEAAPPPPALGRGPAGRRGARPGHRPAPPAPATPRSAAAAATTASPAPTPVGSNPGAAAPPLAPWPAWLGLALLLAGAAGAGARRARPRPAAARALSQPVVERVP